MDKRIKMQCLTCEGTYFSTCEDNLTYFHACLDILISEGEYGERPNKRDENVGKNQEGKGRNKIN